MIATIIITAIIAIIITAAMLLPRVHHWTHRALRAEAAIDRINAEIEDHRITFKPKMIKNVDYEIIKEPISGKTSYKLKYRITEAGHQKLVNHVLKIVLVRVNPEIIL